MLHPGATLHVHGIEGSVPTDLLDELPASFAGVLDDEGWSYLVFTEPVDDLLAAVGLESSYEATLPYAQWLDGDLSTPIAVAGLTIVPVWSDAPQAAAPDRLIHLDPSLAFGTGAHATTHRCLQLMSELFGQSSGTTAPPETVLDLGCGTGLLGLAALRFGARRVWGCDTSALAAEVARQNAARNSLQDRATFLHAAAADVARPADLVLANLPPAALGELLGHPALREASTTTIIASGMLASGLVELRRGVPPQIEVAETQVDGFWHTAVLRRR